MDPNPFRSDGANYRLLRNARKGAARRRSVAFGLTMALRLHVVGVLACVLIVPAFADEIPHADTQAGMNENAAKKLAAVEVEMRQILDELERRAGSNRGAIASLEKAQAAWVSYRDAQIEALWPSEDPGAYGSVHPMCISIVRRTMTEQRIGELRRMLSPTEGDACQSAWPN